MSSLVFGRAGSKAERDAVCAKTTNRLERLLQDVAPSMTTVVSRDVVAMAILHTSSDSQEIARAKKHLNLALSELRSSAAPDVTLQIWGCFLRKYLGKAHVLSNDKKAAYEEFESAEAQWRALLAAFDEKATWPRLLLESERAIAKLACLDVDRQRAPTSWREDVEEHIREAENAFSPIRTVKAQYAKVFGP